MQVMQVMQVMHVSPLLNVMRSCFIECGLLPIKFVLMKRRMMYLHNIFRISKSELIRKVYGAQKYIPTKKDWLELLAEIVLANNLLLAGTVPVNKFLLAGTPKKFKFQKISPPP